MGDLNGGIDKPRTSCYSIHVLMYEYIFTYMTTHS